MVEVERPSCLFPMSYGGIFRGAACPAESYLSCNTYMPRNLSDRWNVDREIPKDGVKLELEIDEEGCVVEAEG